MREVEVGCKVCGKRMLADGSPAEWLDTDADEIDAKPFARFNRTCNACKVKQRREYSRKLAAKRKAERHAFKAEMSVSRCQHCGKPIERATRLSLETEPKPQWVWARKFCENNCRQAAFRARQADR
jgi:hypothetical protein